MTAVNPTIHIALPVLDELENLPAFIGCLRAQTHHRFKLFICVNQPDSWWDLEEKRPFCLRNEKSLEYLHSLDGLDLMVLDRSSKGLGWPIKRGGVGHARKLLMDTISEEADPGDLMVSLDADTTFGPGYLRSIAASFAAHPRIAALAVPYYHRLTGDVQKDRAILRYELFMRHYAINLWRIRSPYSFTAIGSAIALPVSAYKAIRGITPHASGEDFYFLQKLRKFGPVLTWNPEKVYPAARYSSRVGFGTGPAMIRGAGGDWKSYPVYPSEYFDDIRQTYDLLPVLFKEDIPLPIDPFIRSKFGNDSIWQPLRLNSKTPQQFVAACHRKLDAFRVLQYLKWRAEEDRFNDEESLFNCLEKYFSGHYQSLPFDPAGFSFQDSPADHVAWVRDLLVTIEEDFQKTSLLTHAFES